MFLIGIKVGQECPVGEERTTGITMVAMSTCRLVPRFQIHQTKEKLAAKAVSRKC
jgi:hypothetical protein